MGDNSEDWKGAKYLHIHSVRRRVDKIQSSITGFLSSIERRFPSNWDRAKEELIYPLNRASKYTSRIHNMATSEKNHRLRNEAFKRHFGESYGFGLSDIQKPRSLYVPENSIEGIQMACSLAHSEGVEDALARYMNDQNSDTANFGQSLPLNNWEEKDRYDETCIEGIKSIEKEAETAVEITFENITQGEDIWCHLERGLAEEGLEISVKDELKNILKTGIEEDHPYFCK